MSYNNDQERIEIQVALAKWIKEFGELHLKNCEGSDPFEPAEDDDEDTLNNKKLLRLWLIPKPLLRITYGYKGKIKSSSGKIGISPLGVNHPKSPPMKRRK